MDIQSAGSAVRANVGRVIVSKQEIVNLALVALLCEGHLLLEDVPGIGKTTLAKALARSLGCTFVYFIFSLLAIALARLEEAGRELALDWKWAGVLLGTIAATVGMGYLVTQLFTLQVVNTILPSL